MALPFYVPNDVLFGPRQLVESRQPVPSRMADSVPDPNDAYWAEMRRDEDRAVMLLVLPTAGLTVIGGLVFGWTGAFLGFAIGVVGTYLFLRAVIDIGDSIGGFFKQAIGVI